MSVKFEVLWAIFILIIIALFSLEFKHSYDYASSLIIGFLIWLIGVCVYHLAKKIE